MSTPPASHESPLPASAANSTTGSAALGAVSPAQPNGQLVLVVDDDVSLRSTAAMMLEIQGFRTITARHGLEAIQQLERHPEISAILLDVFMPVMDGEETFRAVRSSWSSIPIILFSGFELGDIATRFGYPLPDGYVQKPFTIAKLTSAVTGVLH